MHNLDSLHRTLLLNYLGDHDNCVKIIDVPFSNHTPVRVLNKSGLLTKMINSFVYTNSVNVNQIEKECKKAYKHHAKSYIQYLRNNIDFLPINEVKQLSLSLYQSEEKKDFEFYYMAAEVFSKIGLCDFAVEASLRSINMNIERDYLYLKHANILNQCISTSSALEFISKLNGNIAQSNIIKEFSNRLKVSL